jgi:hypothetical protein
VDNVEAWRRLAFTAGMPKSVIYPDGEDSEYGIGKTACKNFLRDSWIIIFDLVTAAERDEVVPRELRYGSAEEMKQNICRRGLCCPGGIGHENGLWRFCIKKL